MPMISDNLAQPAAVAGTQPPTPGDQPAPTEDAGFPAEEWADRVDAAAAKILYDEKSGDSLAKGIAGGDAPSAVAQTTADLIINIDDKLGGKIPEEDILPAAVKVLERVVEVREQSTGSEMPDEEVKQAFSQMMQLLAREYGTTPEQAQEFAGEFGEEEIANANQMFGGQ